MNKEFIQKLIYQLVSKLFVFPIYKFLFKGHLIGQNNIPKNDPANIHKDIMIHIILNCIYIYKLMCFF